MYKQQSSYLAFILRMRWADDAGQPVWRITMARPGHPGEIQLESLSALQAYLQAQMEAATAKETALDHKAVNADSAAAQSEGETVTDRNDSSA